MCLQAGDRRPLVAPCRPKAVRRMINMASVKCKRIRCYLCCLIPFAAVRCRTATLATNEHLGEGGPPASLTSPYAILSFRLSRTAEHHRHRHRHHQPRITGCFRSRQDLRLETSGRIGFICRRRHHRCPRRGKTVHNRYTAL